MRRVPLSWRQPRTAGFALITVLLFIVLILGLVLIFLAQSTTARQTSFSGLNTTKASLLADSAASTIIGDLKQEIVDGSTLTTPASGQNVYTPLSNFNAKPALAGFVPTYQPLAINSTSMPAVIESDGLANLVKRSASGVPFYQSNGNAVYTETGPARACSVNSTAPSSSGRFISAADWNSHYLIAQQNPASTTDSTPVSAFTPPDWIMVARDGSNPTTFSAPLADSSVSNSSFVVGRYAYAIYDEGGLLNVNAAGYPTSLTPAQIRANKGYPPLADLSQLPAAAGAPVGTGTDASMLTAQQINNLVGWRNYASAGLTSGNGTFGNVSFTSSSATTWLNNFVSNPATGFYNTNGFLNVIAPAGAVASATDQQFLSRQQLISLTQSLNIPPAALQYLGTFSRALEQPSNSPDPHRPIIIGSAVPDPNNPDLYQGNNDSVGGDNQINPAFLSIRVPGAAGSTSFTRLNGTKAIGGEPLVKTKFALRWLPMVAYNATNSSLPSSFAPTASDPDPIYDRFGLKRSSTLSPWTYNHGAGHIMTLSQVAAAGREPDFAELLKAAIVAGSLAKGGPNLLNGYFEYQFGIDTTLDYNVLQVMANLIDQADTDSYPTQIQMADSGGTMHVFSGDEDLPYFYRYHMMTVTTVLPAFSPPMTILKSQSPYTTTPVPTVTNPGTVQFLFIPDIWNPHDPSTLQTSATNRPTQFRLTAATADPLGGSTWSIVVAMGQITTGANAGWPETDSTPVTLTPGNSWLTFSDAGGTLFREPTLLWIPNFPTGSNLTAAPDGMVTDVNTNRQWVGINAGSLILDQNGMTAGGNPCVFVAPEDVFPTLTVPAGASPQITFSLQYQDASGNWITYDSKYPDMHGMQGPDPVVNTGDFPVPTEYENPLLTGQFSDQTAAMDPRTGRFGMGTSVQLGAAGPNGSGSAQWGNPAFFTLEPAISGIMSGSNPNTAANNAVVNKLNFSVIETDRARADGGDLVRYSNPGLTSSAHAVQNRWFSGAGYSASLPNATGPDEFDGLFSQNDPSVPVTGRTGGPGELYYEDADGVARRAMGAYAPKGANYIAAYNNSTPPTLASIKSTTTYPGLPLARATIYTGLDGTSPGTPFAQSQSRPMILNRPFQSVAEMSYAFRGTPWKNIDFFTPESGDSALLDTFCINDPPPNAVVAGKVDLNTRQEPVLQAVISKATLDEQQNYNTPPAWAISNPASSIDAQNTITSLDAQNIAGRLVGITTDTTDAWRGPLANIGNLVSRYVPNAGTPSGSPPDLYTFDETVTGKTYSYSGLTGALDNTVYASDASGASGIIQRLHEAALRPLADQGQTRVWNLLIDIVAQSGRCPKNATSLSQFVVDGEKRIWLHVAIDRLTGQVIDQQVENVTQ